MPSLAPSSARAPTSPAQSLADLLQPENVFLDLRATTKATFLTEIAKRLHDAARLPWQSIHEALLAREKLGSTGLGLGFALPHARLPGLAHMVAAFVRPELPIPFDAPDIKPVTDALVLLVPEQAIEPHLQVVAAVAGLFRDHAFRSRLRASDDPAAIAELFHRYLSAR